MVLLNASRCECGEIYLPPKVRCIKCRGMTQPTKIKGSGQILSYTVLYSPPDGFQAPKVLGIVELNDIKDATKNKKLPKLLCEGCITETELQIGLKVQVVKKNEKFFFKKL